LEIIMSKTVVVSVETTSQQFAAGTVAAGVSISLSGGAAAAQLVSAAPYSATFSDVAPGTYTASAQTVDASGNAIGALAVSAEFTIVADTVGSDIPSIVSVSVQ